MEFKKLGQELDRNNYFKNIALKVSDHCLKSFDSNEIADEEAECLKKMAKNLHFVVEKGNMDHYAIMGQPYKSW